jgi:D-glycero-D-manno-heptose 1,7-bisphosphate phosphatase
MRGILLDRDGVINRERADYVKHWDEFCFLPGVLPALRRLAQLPYPIVVVTNQSVIGRGLVERQVIDAIHVQAQRVIADAGGRIDAFFVCPHHPDAQCACRKPKPGLLQQAAAAFDFTLTQSIFVGDAITDYLAATAAGCQAILVRSGRQGAALPSLIDQQRLAHQQAAAPPVVADLAAATELIFAQAPVAN